ncbi:putative RNA-binding protein Luc7-like 1 isoform X8 [Crotalus tigris]|nr:putative RNA-binding protein Luc7-like 1 isoform X8 [Crotalus tigris]
MDLGECTKIHDLALRADYEIASKERDLFFELDAMDHLESFIAECDRRTELAKKRLAETQEEISAEVAAKAEKVHELNEDIGKLLAKAEQLGAEGNVDESQKILMEVDKVRAKKKDAEEEYRNSMPASSFQQQKLRVCEVCSAYLGLHDNDRRLADHFGGKLHLGFIQIREKLDQLRKTVAEKQEKRNQDRLRRREEREREERVGQRSGSRNRDRRRSRSRERRRRRSRSLSREKRKSRSKSRERERHRRHRSRSGSHSRGHRRGSRDRSSKHKPANPVFPSVRDDFPASSNIFRFCRRHAVHLYGLDSEGEDPLGIDLQERNLGTGRRKRRVRLNGGTRAPMANLAPRGRRRGKLARSELPPRDPSCTVNSLEKHSTRPKSLIYINGRQHILL